MSMYLPALTPSFKTHYGKKRTDCVTVENFDGSASVGHEAVPHNLGSSIYLSRLMGKPTMWFPTTYDKN